MRIAQPVTVVLSTAGLLLAPSAASASHLAMPESTLFHDGKIYVSLIGDPENNDGSIVTVDLKGKVTGTLARASTAKPLIDPTGMAITGSTLWVNDVTRIRSFDLKTGAAGRVINISGAIFVNDLAADGGGNLWASDSETHSLYRISAAGQVKRLRLPKRFRGRPNGVALHPRTGELWFVTFGAKGAPQVGRVTRGGKFAEVSASPLLRDLDGLAFVGRTAYISDVENGSIWRLSPNGKLTRRAVVAGGLADISYAPALKRLLVPLIQGGHFVTIKP